MLSGLAPSLQIDLAAAHAAEQQRTARDRAQAARVRRSRFGRHAAGSNR